MQSFKSLQGKLAQVLCDHCQILIQIDFPIATTFIFSYIRGMMNSWPQGLMIGVMAMPMRVNTFWGSGARQTGTA